MCCKGLDFQDFVCERAPSRVEEGVEGVLKGKKRVHEETFRTVSVLINIARQFFLIILSLSHFDESRLLQ